MAGRMKKNISKETEDKIKNLKHIVFDLDGTLYKGKTLFPTTIPLLNLLDSLNISYTFITNNSSLDAKGYVKKLNKLGIPASIDNVFTSGLATISWLKKNMPYAKKLFILGTRALRKEFSENGFVITGEDPESPPDAVIVGFDKELYYGKLCMAAWWISQGKPYIATHPDRMCPTDEKIWLVDCGAFIKCLEESTGIRPYAVLGKPSPSMITGAIDKLNIKKTQTAMIGDRLYTDMKMAKTTGVLSVLVLTGETTEEMLEKSQIKPDIVCSDLNEFGELIKELRS